MMKKTVIFMLLFVFGFFNFSFAQTNASQMQRAQELLEKEEILREQLAKPEKFYIKKIIVQGSRVLLEEEIEFIVSPFQKHWLTKQDIQQLLNTIKQAYKQKGAGQPADISYQIKKKELIIAIKE